jgi:V8-like Glu-specific endopeptidase
VVATTVYRPGVWPQWPASIPWDVGVVQLKRSTPSMRFMPVVASNTINSTQINVGGYPSDKSMYTMWRTDCDVKDFNGTDSVTALTGE